MSGVGILLIGHGTRDEIGLTEFAEVVRLVANHFRSLAVESAFLELAAPAISIGLDRLVARGARRIVAAPLLLFAAGHAKQDIPAALRAAVSQHPEIEWQQADALGCHPALLELSAQRFHQSLAETTCDLQRCRLIVVGRGSQDAEATRETVKYAELLSGLVGIGDLQTSFLAMAEPRLSVVLQEAANSDRETIVVQPHLLFHGELLTEVRQQVRDWSARVPTKQWLITGHLGPAPQVVAAVVERCQLVISH